MAAGTPGETAPAAAIASLPPARSCGRAVHVSLGRSSECHRTPSAPAADAPKPQLAGAAPQKAYPSCAAASDRAAAQTRLMAARAAPQSAPRLPAVVRLSPAALAAWPTGPLAHRHA